MVWSSPNELPSRIGLCRRSNNCVLMICICCGFLCDIQLAPQHGKRPVHLNHADLYAGHSDRESELGSAAGCSNTVLHRPVETA
jgi:hypothetical protein